jgi:hypothetical protein
LCSWFLWKALDEEGCTWPWGSTIRANLALLVSRECGGIENLEEFFFFPEKVWKKQKFARGGLEKRIFLQEEVWKKGNFLQELFGRKNFARGALGQTIS